MKRFSLKDLNVNEKINLLKELGYDSDGELVLDKEGNPVIDKYVGVKVNLNNMLIFPGSTIILDNNPVSISEYIEEYHKDL